MLRDADATFARVAWEMELLTLEDLLLAAATHARTGATTLRETLVRERWLTEEEALAVARGVIDRPLGRGMRGRRYELGDVLGKGANGVVHLAGDRRLGRQVALKLHGKGAELSDIELGRFAHEAQVTGQLPHPSVVPVHDLGVLPDGRPFYAMKRIEGETLKDVVDSIKQDLGDYVETWTVPHLVSVLLRVAQACAFAHDRGVIHRDIKPANIMVGEYGEVLLLDWGVARVLGQAEEGRQPVATWRSEGLEDMTVMGTVAGTPAYMAPEQARGDIDLIGPATDVYSIGIVLYEYLTRRRPFRASNVRELLDKVVSEPIVPPSRTRMGRYVDPELEALVMRCIEKAPADRFADGRALAEALEAFLEGSRRREEARRLTRRAMGKSAAYAKAAEAAGRMEEDLRRRQVRLAPWAQPAQRRPLWDQERQWRELRSLRDDTYDEAVALFQGALENEPHDEEARAGLAALYLRRMDEAEARGETSAARFFRAQVLRYDTGVLRLLLDGNTTLALQSDPPGAAVALYELVEEGRALRRGLRVELGPTPLSELALPAGSHVIDLRAEGRVSVTLHLYVSRAEQISQRIRLLRPEDLQPGFMHVPAGPFIQGGDPSALDSARRTTPKMADFAIGRDPVTLAEFRRFLEDEGARAGFTCWTGPEELPPDQAALLPALGVSRPGAQAYAAWLSERTGRRFRLPTGAEWEKAGRGVDGRTYPWGNTWEPTFCNGPDAVSGQPAPLPIGSFPEDESVYGVRDLAGGVCEWVSGEVPHRFDRGWLRGGSWNSHPQQARLCSRLTAPLDGRGGTIGFRLVQELA
jgi:eukaryotic-like serine/threonine-protein kinase